MQEGSFLSNWSHFVCVTQETESLSAFYEATNAPFRLKDLKLGNAVSLELIMVLDKQLDG